MEVNKNIIKENKNAIPIWRFVQETAFGEYYHEIRKYPNHFAAVTNVSKANNGEGCVFPNHFATYYDALDTLAYFRPGIRLVSRPEVYVCLNTLKSRKPSL